LAAPSSRENWVWQCKWLNVGIEVIYGLQMTNDKFIASPGLSGDWICR
jgi:hypothetical protein